MPLKTACLPIFLSCLFLALYGCSGEGGGTTPGLGGSGGGGIAGSGDGGRDSNDDSELIVDVGGDTNSEDNTTPEPPPVGSNTAIDYSFDGVWTQHCTQVDPVEPTSNFSTIWATIEAGNISTTSFLFQDSNCNIPDDPASVQTESSLSFPGTTVSTSLGNATAVDITLNSYAADDVLAGPQLQELVGVGVTRYDIVLLLDNDLYTGDVAGEQDGSSPQRRPTQLDQSLIFTRFTDPATNN